MMQKSGRRSFNEIVSVRKGKFFPFQSCDGAPETGYYVKV